MATPCSSIALGRREAAPNDTKPKTDPHRAAVQVSLSRIQNVNRCIATRCNKINNVLDGCRVAATRRYPLGFAEINAP